ncbi:hypothetical protein CYLTODRAFT_345594 [Cylindrobasidium torrendii FP15055 ss-10]|uniref:Glycosyltransferase family 32 protein n=1 Tax=Cylindrobasidium torrendii FP15055 ss-10 TaxID=1314674 RepID=A0A0D7BN18_9AGAR|nr:hypothetical protein CYLTODRAFT_345594 [Cylindrobasidium torrendii FP15055 ss-10]
MSGDELPIYKGHKSQPSWTKQVLVPIPGVPARRLRLVVPNSTRIQQLGSGRWGRKRGFVLLLAACLAMVLTVSALRRSFGRHGASWDGFQQEQEPSTLVYRRDDLRRIWEWEIASGHYPSKRSIPKEIGFKSPPSNPSLPFRGRNIPPSRFRPPPTVVTTNADTDALGVGPKRIYPDIQAAPPNVAYPPRPVPGSIADLDAVMRHCDFSENKYVRDCLEVMRLGAGLDNGEHTRRGKMDDWKYIYVEAPADDAVQKQDPNPVVPAPVFRPPVSVMTEDPEAGLWKKPDASLESPVRFEKPIPPRLYGGECDPENPRLFHMFWTGPFTDKPYLALLSFLFTQNTGIHLKEGSETTPVCRPQFWLWINPGPAAAVPNPNALTDMFADLKSNPWAAPFLHPRFKDVIRFKMWNTTEQLDGVPELKDEWRALQDSLFNSGGIVINVPKEKGADNATSSTAAEGDDIHNRTGSKSSSSYDRLSVILSDMARFVLCHRFGGIYLDADTIFLRDWEELWGWRGAFAYRWSRLEKYNTAVLKMSKGSALGTFLFRTAMKNGLDFHPMSISRYMHDAHSDDLLLRLPDALFDSAWLNTEYFQRDRPPQPYFTEFGEFFDTPLITSAAPQALGFHGFFRGAFSYHFHNFWWKPFDPSRNFPDLGPRFAATEEVARANVNATRMGDDGDEDVYADKRDLDWSTVLKRSFEAYLRGERANMYGESIEW